MKQVENTTTNKEVKLLLVEFLSDKIQFCKPYQANQLLIVFSSNLSVEHIIRKLQSINTIKSAATEIRKSLNESTFDLKNKFCNAEGLKNSWNNTHMPHELIYFFSHLFNIPQSYFCNHQVNACDIEDDDDGPDLTRKVMKIKSLYQILYYNLLGGKKKAPLHLFIGHSVYEKCKSREVLTSLNKAGFL